MRGRREARRRAQAESEFVDRSPKVSPKPKTADDVDFEPNGTRLGELLLERGTIGRDQLIDAILAPEGDGRKLGSILVAAHALTEDELTEVLAHQAGVERVDLRDVEAEEDAVGRLPEAMARELNAVPINSRDDGSLDVVTSSPDPETHRRLEELTGATVHLKADHLERVQLSLDSAYRALGDVPQFIERFEAADSIRHAVETVSEGAAMEDAPVIQVVNLLIIQALRDRASDIHIEPLETHVRLRFRIDGVLHDILELPASMALALVSRLKILSNLNIVERRRPQDGQMSMVVEGHDINVRVAIVPTMFGEKVVLRLLDKSRPLSTQRSWACPKKRRNDTRS